jgi:hypothetical protein
MICTRKVKNDIISMIFDLHIVYPKKMNFLIIVNPLLFYLLYTRALSLLTIDYFSIMLAYVLSVLLLIIASFQGIIIPIMAENFVSGYFICFMSTLQFSPFIVIVYLIYLCKIRNQNDATEYKEIGTDNSTHEEYSEYDELNNYAGVNVNSTNSRTEINGTAFKNETSDRSQVTLTGRTIMVMSGTFMGVSSLFMIYSSNPERTPIILQLILNGLNIIPSFLFTKYYLKKNVNYDKKYCFWSIVTLIMSIVISIIPITDFDFDSVIWPLIFLISQIFRVVGYILQEKYFMITNDRSTRNKLYNIAYCRFVQLIVTLMLFWLDVVMGYDPTFDPLISDFKQMNGSNTEFVLLELFVLSTIFFCIVAGYLNSISTNYSSVALTLVTPVVGLFFSLFPNLNDGNHYPLYITIPSLTLNLVSTFLWMKGEKH